MHTQVEAASAAADGLRFLRLFGAPPAGGLHKTSLVFGAPPDGVLLRQAYPPRELQLQSSLVKLFASRVGGVGLQKFSCMLSVMKS